MSSIVTLMMQDGYTESNTRVTVRRLADEGAIEQLARGKYRMLQAVA